MSFFQLAFGFQGRIRRRDFWLGHILLAFVIGFTVMILFPVAGTALGIPRSSMSSSTPVDLLIRLLLLWPVLAIAVKRGHDRNRPTAWIVGLYAADYAVDLLALSGGSFRSWAGIVELVFLAYVIVDLGLLDGSKGTNRFGPSPKPIASGMKEMAGSDAPRPDVLPNSG